MPLAGVAEAPVPSPRSERLAEMTLQLPAQAPRRFVATDRVDGFFEGYTGIAGLGRYQVGNDVLLAGIEVAVDDRLQTRSAVRVAPELRPNQLLSTFDQVQEQLLLMQGQRSIATRWIVNAPARLSARFQLPAEATIEPAGEKGDGLWLFSLRYGDSRWYLALRSEPSAQVRLEPLQGGGSQQLIVDVTAQTVLAVSLSYARSADQALRDASAFAPEQLPAALQARLERQFASSIFQSSDRSYNQALAWASFSAQSFVVEEFGKGIWAGLPWFRDNWGRDTFIALPGTLLVTGRFAEAKAVLDNFARLQQRADPDDPEYGRIPNRVAAGDKIIYNTVDGTPWLIRELLEYLRYTGDVEYGQQLLPLVESYVRGVERHWLDDNGLLTHDDADTWMDARIAGKAAWSPRGNRAVEIQALWFTALDVAAELNALNGNAEAAQHYRARAEQVKLAFPNRFWNGRQMADRLHADGTADLRLRPNQLMLISIPFAPFLAEDIEAQVLRQSVSGLLFSHGIASLDPRDPAFHPRHENPAFHHKDAAYHNGTIWGWNAGFTVTVLNKFGYHDLAWQLSRKLSAQILHGETPGTMSELLDALPDEHGQSQPSGTYAQAWSVSEFVRNAYQDYLGFRPDLLRNRLHFFPALPSDWTSVMAKLAFGKDEALQLSLRRDNQRWSWHFASETAQGRELSFDLLAADGSRHRVRFLWQNKHHELSWDGKRATLDGKPLASTLSMASQQQRIGALRFLTPPVYRPADYPVLRGKDVLQREILASPAAAAAKPVNH